MPNWRLAKSLLKLREQVNAAYPNRSKVSDGSVGDLRHSQRASDHNPNSEGVVTAIDITHDLANGVDGKELSKNLITDPRTKYVIFSGRIWKARTGKWETYRGANKHTAHVHISVNAETADDDRPWNLGKPKDKPAKTVPKPAQQAGDTVTLKSTTESPSGEVTTETKKIAMTETSPTAKRLTLGAVITAAIGFIQQAWQTSQEATVSGIQFLMKRMPMVLLILGILLFAYWIWKKSQESRDARLELIVDTNTDKSKDDVKIV